MNRPLPRGQSAVPILVFLGIVTLSVVFFFAFTAPQCGGPRPAVATVPIKSVPPPPVPKLDAPIKPVPKITATEPPVPKRPFYMKSSQFLAAVAEKLATGKVAETLELIAPGVSTERKALYQQLFTSGYKPTSSADPSAWKEIGRISGQERWELPLEAPAKISLSSGDTAPPEPSAPSTAPTLPKLYVDLKLSREEGYLITNLRFSPDLAGSDPALLDPPDPLTISHDFVTEVLGKNFRGARQITDGSKVTHEKLAGLCIVFEEGEYTVVPGNSLNVTAANADRAWALVRVKSPKQNTESEFGVEMSKDANDAWKVDSLDFSKLLQSYVQSTDAGKVYYSPIVKNPNGGESLVVYFEYDKSDLSERGNHQLEIVADLLKSDPARKMRLSGYADALGSEDYNYQLSKRRAESVQKKLAELGVPNEQIVSQGFGAEAPLDPNKKADGTDNPEGRSRNRRTEIYLDF